MNRDVANEFIDQLCNTRLGIQAELVSNVLKLIEKGKGLPEIAAEVSLNPSISGRYIKCVNKSTLYNPQGVETQTLNDALLRGGYVPLIEIMYSSEDTKVPEKPFEYVKKILKYSNKFLEENKISSPIGKQKAQTFALFWGFGMLTQIEHYLTSGNKDRDIIIEDNNFRFKHSVHKTRMALIKKLDLPPYLGTNENVNEHNYDVSRYIEGTNIPYCQLVRGINLVLGINGEGIMTSQHLCLDEDVLMRKRNQVKFQDSLETLIANVDQSCFKNILDIYEVPKNE